jgi:hypothetical protein
MLCVLSALLLGALAGAAPAAANSISAGDTQVVESNSTAFAVFTVTRQAGLLSGSTVVGFQTVDGSASSPADYAAVNGTLSFGSAVFGATQTQQIAVAVKGDALDEPDETFRLVLSGSEVADSDATATILDDDPQPSVSVGDSAAVAEGAAGAHASFAVRLSAPSGRSVSIPYATADVTATAGQDYTARSGTLVLAPGSTQATVDVPVLDDSADEPNETFELRLGTPVGATVADGAGSATIGDDDQPPASAPPPPPPPSPAGDSKPSSSSSGGGSQPAGAGGSPTGPVTGSSTSTGASSAPTALGVASPRLKRPSTMLVTLSCPLVAGRCSGTITLFSVPNRRSSIKALRKERRLGRLTFKLAGGRSQTLALGMGRADRALLERTGRMNVRAYAVTQDASGKTGVRTVSGTLIARTAHSRPSRR